MGFSSLARGSDTPSPVQLALRLINNLPNKLTQAFRVIILADTAFGSVIFLQGVRKRRYAAIVGVRYDRKLEDGRARVRPLQAGTTGAPGWFVLPRNDFLVVPQAGRQIGETICPLHSPPQGQYHHLVGEAPLGD